MTREGEDNELWYAAFALFRVGPRLEDDAGAHRLGSRQV